MSGRLTRVVFTVTSWQARNPNYSQIAHSYRLYSMQSSYTRPVEGALTVTQLFNIDYETQGD